MYDLIIIGAFANFTLGYEGKSGGFGLELGGSANENIYSGLSISLIGAIIITVIVE